MKRFAGILIIFSAIFLVAQSAAAQAWSQPWARERLEKSPRHREWVTVKHGGRSVELFIVYPESKEKRPVVLIIHEIFGLSDWAQELADEVAAAGRKKQRHRASRSDSSRSGKSGRRPSRTRRRTICHSMRGASG